ncbi:MAG: tripartite tricarboxylate transporter substrate-binding protein [Burkholderiaceae bacterium]
MQRRALLGAALLALPAVGRTEAVAFPQRPITLVVPFGPGGVADVTARTVGKAMGESLGQPVIVDNRPGAGGIVAGQAVLQAPRDGHTLLLMSNASAVSVHLVRKLPYDVQRDFTPISTLGFFELALVVNASSRFKTLADLLAFAKANPNQLSIGTITAGSTQHLAAEWFKAMTGIVATVVPYKGSPAVVNALRAGEVDLVFEILSPLLPQVAARALRPLAVTGPQRAAPWPEVPTVAEQGWPAYQVDSWNALAAPAGTPPAAVARLQRAVAEAVNQPGVRSSLRELGVKPQAGTPAEATALLAREIQHWGAVVRAAHIAPE